MRKNNSAFLGIALGFASVISPISNAEINPVEIQKLIPEDGAVERNFGTSVAISGDTIVVGIQKEYKGNVSPTSLLHTTLALAQPEGNANAYVFEKQRDVWIQTDKLVVNHDSVQIGNIFGIRVAIDGNIIGIGFEIAETTYAYIFERTANGWVQTAKLDPGAILQSDGISIEEGTVFLTSSRMVYVYEKVNGAWTQVGGFTAGDENTSLRSLAISGDVAVVGASTYRPDSNNFINSAYVFGKTENGWSGLTTIATLTASEAMPGKTLQHFSFGETVGIGGNTIFVGAPYYNDSEGTVFAFEKPVGGWVDMTETAKLSPSFALENFGYSIAIQDEIVLVGTRSNDPVYIYEKPVKGWSDMIETSTLISSEYSGWDVNISGNYIVIGTPFEEIKNRSIQGAVYVFSLGGTTAISHWNLYD